jgi:hypothetical protein
MTRRPVLDCLMEAKAAREVIRAAIVKAIIRDRAVTPEVEALLTADTLATSNLQTAMEAYRRLEPVSETPCQIPDSTTQHPEAP